MLVDARVGGCMDSPVELLDLDIHARKNQPPSVSSLGAMSDATDTQALEEHRR